MFRVSAIDRWIQVFIPKPLAALRIVCFPYAGGTALAFRQWADLLPQWMEVCAVQLPGRLQSIDRPPFTAMTDLVPPLTDAVAQLCDRPCVFFGHSLGALVSFEVSRWLRCCYDTAPAHLFVSGRRAPHIPDSAPTVYDQSGEEVLRKLQRLNGTAPEVLDDPDLIDMLLPMLRADFQLVETYRHREDAPLSCPITAFGGAEDAETVGENLEAWGAHTARRFTRHVLPGDHFFIRSSERRLLDLIRLELATEQCISAWG